MTRGDHLVTQRTGYTHHGLYLGDNKVIHYAGLSDDLNKGKIEITSYEDFSQNKDTYKKDYPLRVYNEEESIERACSRLGEDKYNVVFNNCEHFVTWCILGIPVSEQVGKVANNIYSIIEEQWKNKSKDVIFQQLVKDVVNEKLIKHTVPSIVGKTVLTNAVGTTAGVATASAITGGTIGGITTAIATGSLATAAAPLAIATGVGYGVIKAIDWFWD